MCSEAAETNLEKYINKGYRQDNASIHYHSITATFNSRSQNEPQKVTSNNVTRQFFCQISQNFTEMWKLHVKHQIPWFALKFRGPTKLWALAFNHQHELNLGISKNNKCVLPCLT